MAASAALVERCVRELDLGGSRIVRLLFRLRGMPRSGIGLEGLERMGFRVLAHEPEREVVLGLIGRFWTREGQLRRFEPHEFASFDEPGWAKATWSFRVAPLPDGRSLLETETRVHCTDAASRRRFRLYWMAIRPFSGLIRRVALREVKRNAEALARSGA